MKFSHAKLITFSGILWLGVGLMLVMKGIGLLMNPLLTYHPLYDFFTSKTAAIGEEAALVVLLLALVIGQIKARLVLRKSVLRVVNRITSKPNPSSLMALYSPGYLALILVMIGLGITLRFLSLPEDIHGAIDVAIGSALTHGATHYFKHARMHRVKT